MKKKAEREAKQQRKQEREEKKECRRREAEKGWREKRKLAEKAENARKAAEVKAEEAKKLSRQKHIYRLVEKKCRLAEKGRRAEEQRATQTIDESSIVTTSNDFVDWEATMQRYGRKQNTDSRSSAAQKEIHRRDGS